MIVVIGSGSRHIPEYIIRRCMDCSATCIGEQCATHPSRYSDNTVDVRLKVHTPPQPLVFEEIPLPKKRGRYWEDKYSRIFRR